MRDNVRAAFVPFTAPLEGVVRWMYADVKGLVTTAIGNLIDPLPPGLPFVNKLTGLAVSEDAIRADWQRIKGDASLAKLGHRACERITMLRLTDEGVNQVVSRKLDEMDRALAKRFPQWELWPADAQLATLSMSWACGPAFHFPTLEAALRSADFGKAATECHINETGNPGVVPRNKANVVLYRNASFLNEDNAATLYWPAVLDAPPTD